nr:TIGR04283 family arsenosugar biosynthesis glycosyltransferase [Oceanococcus sp. HetDA_MAG_MS8]
MQALEVIIPARNEAQALPNLLADLREQRDVALRIWVVDGQSEDNTSKIALAHGAEVLHSAPGRGRQLNRGWRAAAGAALLFLHADSRLPQPQLLAQALRAWQQAPARTAAHFQLRFVDQPPGYEWFFARLESKSGLNLPQTFNGDQGLLIRRDWLQQLGGFDQTLPFLEDQAIGEAIRAQGQWMTLPGQLHTSARRFVTEGTAERYLGMLIIMCARQAGCTDFLRAAPQLYRPQSQINNRLDLLPLLSAGLQAAKTQPAFWEHMADYAWDNMWQLAHSLELLSGGRVPLLPAFLRWQSRSERVQRLTRPLLARSLRQIFAQWLPWLLKQRG